MTNFTYTKRVRWYQLGLVLCLCWLWVTPLQAQERWPAQAGVGLMENMWQLLEWYSGRQSSWRSPSGMRPRQGESVFLPWHEDWHDLGSLEGVWLAQSGEYWVVRRGRFVLIQPWGEAVHGEYRREGHFLRVFGSWGEQRFEFRQMGDVIMVQDVHGQVGLLRRIQAAHWAW